MDINGVGIHSFVLQTERVNADRIPDKDKVGITAVLLTGSFNSKEFFRVGYYVNIQYEEAALNEEPPANPIIEKLVRNVLVDKPRVTKFAIDWGL